MNLFHCFVCSSWHFIPVKHFVIYLLTHSQSLTHFTLPKPIISHTYTHSTDWFGINVFLHISIYVWNVCPAKKLTNCSIIKTFWCRKPDPWRWDFTDYKWAPSSCRHIELHKQDKFVRAYFLSLSKVIWFDFHVKYVTHSDKSCWCIVLYCIVPPVQSDKLQFSLFIRHSSAVSELILHSTWEIKIWTY